MTYTEHLCCYNYTTCILNMYLELTNHTSVNFSVAEQALLCCHIEKHVSFL